MWLRDGEGIPPHPPKYTREDFLKPKFVIRPVPDDQEMSSILEFSSISDTSDLTDLGDLAKLGNLQKDKKEGWPKGKSRK